MLDIVDLEIVSTRSVLEGGTLCEKSAPMGPALPTLMVTTLPAPGAGGGGAQGAVSSQRASSAAQHTAAAHARPPPAAAGSPFTCWWTS